MDLKSKIHNLIKQKEYDLLTAQSYYYNEKGYSLELLSDMCLDIEFIECELKLLKNLIE